MIEALKFIVLWEIKMDYKNPEGRYIKMVQNLCLPTTYNSQGRVKTETSSSYNKNVYEKAKGHIFSQQQFMNRETQSKLNILREKIIMLQEKCWKAEYINEELTNNLNQVQKTKLKLQSQLSMMELKNSTLEQQILSLISDRKTETQFYKTKIIHLEGQLQQMRDKFKNKLKKLQISEGNSVPNVSPKSKQLIDDLTQSLRNLDMEKARQNQTAEQNVFEDNKLQQLSKQELKQLKSILRKTLPNVANLKDHTIYSQTRKTPLSINKKEQEQIYHLHGVETYSITLQQSRLKQGSTQNKKKQREYAAEHQDNNVKEYQNVDLRKFGKGENKSGAFDALSKILNPQSKKLKKSKIFDDEDNRLSHTTHDVATELSNNRAKLQRKFTKEYDHLQIKEKKKEMSLTIVGLEEQIRKIKQNDNEWYKSSEGFNFNINNHQRAQTNHGQNQIPLNVHQLGKKKPTYFS